MNRNIERLEESRAIAEMCSVRLQISISALGRESDIMASLDFSDCETFANAFHKIEYSCMFAKSAGDFDIVQDTWKFPLFRCQHYLEVIRSDQCIGCCGRAVTKKSQKLWPVNGRFCNSFIQAHRAHELIFHKSRETEIAIRLVDSMKRLRAIFVPCSHCPFTQLDAEVVVIGRTALPPNNQPAALPDDCRGRSGVPSSLLDKRRVLVSVLMSV
jgi:hypothetical protein